MKLYRMWLVCLVHTICAIPEQVVIRKAVQQDLPALFTFDRDVSYEYFLPMYSNGYTHLSLGQNAKYYLDLELEQDKTWFPACIEGTAEPLWVAYDMHADKIAGLLIAHQHSATTMELDLLLVAKQYRRKGIGRALVQHALNAFPDAARCELYPLKFANDDTLAFYESIGFTNCGAPTIDKVNIYGVHYKDMYYHFVYERVTNRMILPSQVTRSRLYTKVHGIR